MRTSMSIILLSSSTVCHTLLFLCHPSALLCHPALDAGSPIDKADFKARRQRSIAHHDKSRWKKPFNLLQSSISLLF